MRHERLAVVGPVKVHREAVLVVQRAWLRAARAAPGVLAAGGLEPVAVVFVRAGEVIACAVDAEEEVDLDDLKRRVPALEERLAELPMRAGHTG